MIPIQVLSSLGAFATLAPDDLTALLLGVTMSRKFSLTQSAQTVR